MIGVVIPVLNQHKLAIQALESIESFYRWTPIVIDNSRRGLSVAESWNWGIKKSQERNDYTLVINDDIVMAPYSIDQMYRYLKANPHIGVLTATDYRDHYSVEEVREGRFLDDRQMNQDHGEIDAPDFACFMIGRQGYEEIGEFDENFRPAYFEDNDYTYRSILAGRTARRIQSAGFFHYGSQTQNHNPSHPVVPPPQFIKNRSYYIDKWGGEPGKERYTVPFNRK